MKAQLSFETLPRYQERRFVPDEVDLRDAETVRDLFSRLLERDIESATDLEQLILDGSELAAAIDQQGTILYIRMTCDTTNIDYSEDYKSFIQSVLPAVKPLSDELNRKFLRLNQQYQLDAHRYRVFERDVRADVELFSNENVPLETDVQLLSQEYQSLFGSMMVKMDGKEYTLPAMAKFQLEVDRGLRERTWRAAAERRMQDAQRLDQLFDTMLGLRDTIARNAGFGNFCDYQFKSYHRFDYQPEHCYRYHEVVERCVVPVWEKILKKRKAQMGVDRLRPWDLSVDPMGQPPLKPFEQVAGLVNGVHKIFMHIDPELGKQFGEMMHLGLLDLESRKGKAPGGYQNTLAESRKPFIFMNAVGVDSDVRTLLHEGGHAFHAFASAAEPLLSYRHAPMEFCEVASMTMELLGNDFLGEFYDVRDSRRSIQHHLESVVQILAWVATVDAFQHWIYRYPGHDRRERSRTWEEIYQKFNGTETDWFGLEEIRRALWHRQLHIFEVPFYYIEYGIAQLGALQIWRNAKKDWRGAMTKYKAALALGGSRSLPELFAVAGIEFDFSERTIAPLLDEVVRQLELS